MKKKMTVLGGLLLAALVSAYSVAGTYAKYISSVDFADEARVAKWEFKVNGADPVAFNDFDIDLFKDSYETKAINHQFVVSSEPGVDVVAPGTNGEYSLNLKGTAETNYTVKLDNVEVLNEIKTTDKDGKEYSPIKFSLTQGANALLTDVSIDDLKTELAKLYDGQTVYPANYNLDETLVLSWKWDFEQPVPDSINNMTDEDAKKAAIAAYIAEYDALDTYLAQQQGKVNVKFGVTVTQTQAAATIATNNTKLASTINTKVSSADLADLTKMGYDATLARNVKAEVDGTTIKLTGEINKTTKDEGFSSVESDRTGYYYPITIKANQASTVSFSPSKTQDIAAGESLTILYALKDGDKKTTITVTNKADNADTVTYTVDYTGVTLR